MIAMPRRSVTRFFIPLIDVLTLLFCVFLVTPLAKPNSEAGKAQTEGSKMTPEELEQAYTKTKREFREMEARLVRAEQILNKPIDKRVAMRILEIDAKTGKLYYRDPERVEIRNQADAQALIEHDRQESQQQLRELHYIILYPLDRTSDKPTNDQLRDYERWFGDVQKSFKKPGDSL